MRIAACTHTAPSAGIVHPPAAASSGAVKRLVHGLRAIDSAANHGANTLSYASAQASATLRQRLINRIIQMHPKTKRPKSCFRLAIKYGLSPQEFHVLEMKVVQGPAAKRLRRGESCDTLSRDYGGMGGLSYEARTRLELIAVNGPAAQCLHQGASVSRVCRKWGIITQTAREALQRLALANQAKGDFMPSTLHVESEPVNAAISHPRSDGDGRSDDAVVPTSQITSPR